MTSGSFAANAAWLTLAATAHNLTRTARCLASLIHAEARTATLRRHLITMPPGSPDDPAAPPCG